MPQTTRSPMYWQLAVQSSFILLRYVATCQYIILFYYLVFFCLSFWELSISKVVLNTLESSLFFFYACLVTPIYVLCKILYVLRSCTYIRYVGLVYGCYVVDIVCFVEYLLFLHYCTYRNVNCVIKSVELFVLVKTFQR